MVKEAGLPVVVKKTIVVEGEPVTLPSGLFDVNVTELGITVPLLTFAPRGKSPNVRTAAATTVNLRTYIRTSTLSHRPAAIVFAFATRFCLARCCLLTE
jgi:hypothetical protein